MVVHVLVVCEKANFQGVSPICDKALSSKYVYSLEVYKHSLINHWKFLKKEFLIFNAHFLSITLENETLFIQSSMAHFHSVAYDNGESFCVCGDVC